MKFLNWETAYEDYYYNHHQCQTSSILFDTVMDWIEGTDELVQLECLEFCLAAHYTYKNYTFKQFVGQGVIWHIFKDGEIIFHSS